MSPGIEIFDTIVVGAGVGGLATAALLQHRQAGKRLLVLEAHTRSGGCASAYDRYIALAEGEAKTRFRLDVGATTLSAIGPGLPVDLLCRELGITLSAHHMNPGLRTVLRDGTVVNRYADNGKWKEESARIFGNETIAFWNTIETLAQQAWSVSAKYTRFPFAGLRDLLATIPNVRPHDLLLLKALITPLASTLEAHGLSHHDRFRVFLDELLMVSLQCKSDSSTLLLSALGLDYPSNTFYLDGGVYALSMALERSIENNGAQIRFKHFVTSIERENKHWKISCKNGHEFLAHRIVANTTIWDSTAILKDTRTSSIQKKAERFSNGIWSALFLTGIISDTITEDALYHQLHTPEGSLFVSIARRGDKETAPDGYRIFSVSLHEANAERWFAMSDTEYKQQQERYIAFFEEYLSKYIGGYSEAKKIILELGTPRTFEFYTHRKHGWVGGIPHTRANLPFFWQPAKTKLENVYLVGDTIFPGQGIPGVVRGALNLADRLSPI